MRGVSTKVKKLWYIPLAVIVTVVSLVIPVTTAKGIMPIGISKSSRYQDIVPFKTPYYIGGGKYSLDDAVWTPDYTDSNGQLQNINTQMVDGVMDGADYTFRLLQNTFNAGRIAEFSAGGESVQLQPMPLQWTNDLDQISQIATPQAVLGTTVNTPVELKQGVVTQQGEVEWTGAYGSGLDFTWRTLPTRLSKVLTIDNLNSLPVPPDYIITGGNPVLRLSLIFDPSPDLGIYVDNVLWDKRTKLQTFERIDFRNSLGETLFSFAPLLYWDSQGSQGESIKTVRRAGSSLYIDIVIPYSWLQTAAYPVYIDADVTIEATASTSTENAANRGGPFWVSTTVGYIVYVDSSNDLKYNKTSDGGATWAGPSNIKTGSIVSYDCWTDWQTDGDTGTKIHIAYMDSDGDNIRYVYLDTSGDSVGGDDQIQAAAGDGTIHTSAARSSQQISITKTRGGNIAVAFHYIDSAVTSLYGFYTSPDGNTWTSKAALWEATADVALLFPANLADNQDLWALYWDNDATEITLKTFDNSANSWGEASIAASMTRPASYMHMDGYVRLSDGHLIVAAWNLYDDAAADLMTWDITDGGTITAKANVLTNSAESLCVSTFIDQSTDDVYVAYFKGGVAQATVTAYYQKSTDGMTNWDGQAAMQADAADDERWISAGAVKAAWGGKFQPVWFNDDLNDIFTNTDNGVSIAAAGGGVVEPTVVTNSATSVEETTATLSGNITATGGENCTDRGFQYDTDSGAPYSSNWTESGNFGVSQFTHGISGLDKGEGYYYRAGANNTAGWGWGSEVFFITKPDPATSFTSTENGTTWISLSWANGTGMDYVEVRYAEGSAPTDNTSGTLGYWGSGTTANVTGLGSSTTYFFTIFTHATENSQWSTSDNNPSCQDTTDAGVVVPTVTTQAATDIEATTATGSGNITDTGGENCDIRGFQWDVNSGAPYTNNVTTSGNYSAGTFTGNLTGLPTGTTIYYRAEAHNSAGWGYGNEVTFLTKPAAPTNVAATDGTSTSNVTVTWTKSTGATGYKIYRNGGLLDTVGDVATYDDTTATPAVIGNAGVASASDGTSTAHVTLSLAGEATATTSYTYKLKAFNATGDSVDSGTDTGYRGVGAITYQWQVDSGGGFGNIVGGTTDPYDYVGAEAGTITAGNAVASDGTSTAHVTLSLAGDSVNNGSTWNYRCVVSALGADNSPQNSSTNTGYRGTDIVTYQWQVDSGGGFGNIAGGTTEPYNYVGADAPTVTSGNATASDGTSAAHVTLSVTGETGNNGAIWDYLCTVTGAWASNSPQTSGNNTGYRGTAALTYEWFRSAADADAAYGSIAGEGGTTDPYNDTNGAVDPDGRWYYAEVSMSGAVTQDTTHNRGYRSASVLDYLIATYFNNNYIGLVWDPPAGSVNVTVRARIGSYPSSITDGYEVYSGIALSANDTSQDFDDLDKVYYSGYSSDNSSVWTLFGQDSAGGVGMILLALVLLAIGLTGVMGTTKNPMWGFPCAIFWAILGGYAYVETTGFWPPQDWQAFLAIGSLLGMVPFSVIAAYALRTKKEELAAGEEYIDEGKDDVKFIDEGKGTSKDSELEPDEEKPSKRTRGIRDRADKRRTRWE